MADESHLSLLKQGVKAWNEWRRESQRVRADLSGADLSQTDLNKAIPSKAIPSEERVERRRREQKERLEAEGRKDEKKRREGAVIDVFISYAREDKPRAELIAQVLGKREFRFGGTDIFPPANHTIR
jgi:hypothetical protein